MFFKGQVTLWFNLLEPHEENRFALHPEELSRELAGLDKKPEWVVIDEIQKVPKLLDLVHHHIEQDRIKFALTGSSARRLKRGSANLLAGRALVHTVFPLTHVEMGKKFDLDSALMFGTLPGITQIDNDPEKREFLKSYALTYLKEEIWAEHFLRNLDPFRKFLEIAAQCNGQVLNYANIARDVGVDPKTVQSYFQLLEDTLLGYMLEPFNRSIRKQQRNAPKFYFFDTGVKRALSNQLGLALKPSNYEFGRAFEHLVILEMLRLNMYQQSDLRFSYLLTKDQAEIDLIVEYPNRSYALIEIKSTDHVDERDTRTLERFLPDFKNAKAYCLSRDPHRKKIGSVLALPWQDGLKELGISPGD